MSRIILTEQVSAPDAPGTDKGKKTAALFAKKDGANTVPAAIDSDGTEFDFEGPQGNTGPAGPTGPTGPPGSLATQFVTDINNPTEIESLTLAGIGSDVLAHQNIASGSADLVTSYAYDTDGPAKNAPFVMNTGDGGTTRWIAVISRNTQNGITAADGSRLISAAEVTKLAGIAAGADSLDPSKVLQMYDEFITGNEDTDELGAFGWRVVRGGSNNALTRIDGLAGHPGIIEMVGGTAASGRATMHLGETSGAMNAMVLGSGKIIFESVFRILGTINNHQRSLGGLTQPIIVNGVITEGVFVGIENGDTNWQLFSAASGVTTKLDSGVAFATGVWVNLKFEVNPDKTSIEGFVNGTSFGTITTNIPSVVISPSFKTDALTAGGGTATPFQVDYMLLKQFFTTPR